MHRSAKIGLAVGCVSLLGATALAGAGAAVYFLVLSKPTARDVCEQLSRANVARRCKADVPRGLGADAVEKYVFDVRSPQSGTGQVLRFKNERDLHDAEEAFRGFKILAGPWRFSNERALIFVQMNTEASLADGKRARQVVDDL